MLLRSSAVAPIPVGGVTAACSSPGDGVAGGGGVEAEAVGAVFPVGEVSEEEASEELAVVGGEEVDELVDDDVFGEVVGGSRRSRLSVRRPVVEMDAHLERIRRRWI